jgi:hypothetical protein
MVPRTVLGNAVPLIQLYLAAMPSNEGVNVDGLACPLHRPTVYTH